MEIFCRTTVCSLVAQKLRSHGNFFFNCKNEKNTNRRNYGNILQNYFVCSLVAQKLTSQGDMLSFLRTKEFFLLFVGTKKKKLGH